MTKIGILNASLELLFVLLILMLFPVRGVLVCKLAIVYIVVQFALGRYRDKSLLLWDEIRLLILSHTVFFLIGLLLFPINLVNVLLFGLMTFIYFCFAVLCNRYTRIIFRKYFKKNTVIIGAGKTAKSLGTVCEGNRFALTDVKAYINCNNSNFFRDINQTIVLTGENVKPLSELEKIIEEENIELVFLAIPEMGKHDMKLIYRRIADKVKTIKFLPRVEGLITFDTKVEDYDGLLVTSTSRGTIRTLPKLAKRIMDILGSLVGILALIPLSIYVYYKNRKEGDKDPIFFTQQRIGKDGKSFKIYKFRTMVPNAEQVLEDLMKKDPAIKKEYLTNKKLENDPRITKAGKMLREKSLDEFPQFINVLRGEMSIVGPRPYLLREKEDMGYAYKSIINCKPGVTGMWQTHGRSDVSFEERLELDDYYYRNWNFWLDVTLLIKTVKLVIHGSGAK
ncbi:exopolysaccharide biosynthesis polyprenyl glycosylphosphotransferase [Faecalitalea cylindroides]|uniref:exopolysaccharide biosynthesis polyprenyl glycosylphosphotransferase n=1 Tax=Faecalitalea cylindroides TaxID=39483 RepID=UPI0022E14F4A|nr:exopolysaccharide biosynthesis polyprenyl glycosylphosphotransferase [Faecalitalea cylindroides]